jgi:hypothetical protein
VKPPSKAGLPAAAAVAVVVAAAAVFFAVPATDAAAETVGRSTAAALAGNGGALLGRGRGGVRSPVPPSAPDGRVSRSGGSGRGGALAGRGGGLYVLSGTEADLGRRFPSTTMALDGATGVAAGEGADGASLKARHWRRRMRYCSRRAAACRRERAVVARGAMARTCGGASNPAHDTRRISLSMANSAGGRRRLERILARM